MAITEKWNKLYKLIQSGKYLNFDLLDMKQDYTPNALWSHWLGHLHLPAVLKMSNTEVASGMPCLQANNGKNRCTAYVTGKMTLILFRASTHRTKTPLELVHSDLCGTMQTQSLGGCRYFILFINHFTKYTSVVTILLLSLCATGNYSRLLPTWVWSFLSNRSGSTIASDSTQLACLSCW